jgi:hypothetical protein
VTTDRTRSEVLTVPLGAACLACSAVLVKVAGSSPGSKRPSTGQLIGGALVLAGVVVATRNPSRAIRRIELTTADPAVRPP